MGLRFRKRIKLAPGIHLNVSRSGISTSIGKPGATVNLRGDRTRATIGLPGTGLSHTTDHPVSGAAALAVLIVFFGFIWALLG